MVGDVRQHMAQPASDEVNVFLSGHSPWFK
jgi:hypothetical protein